MHEGEDAHDLPRRSLNSAGQLLVRLSFNNSTRSGLWLSGIPAPLTDPISYAALGDSYSSGEGAPPYLAGTDDPGNKCHRSTRAYSTQLRTPGNSRSLYELAVTEPGFEWDFLACSGAESDNVRSAGEVIYDELPQLDPSNNVDAGRDLVTISIGGNDAFFSWILMLCLVHEECHAWEPFEPLTELTFEELFPLLAAYAKVKAGEVHAEVRAATPNAPTVVVGYPQVLGGRECPNVGIPLVSLTADEQAFMRNATSLLNTRLAESAAEVGVHFVPAETHFAGHGACGTKGDWIHGLLPFTPVSSFHPKVRGQIEFGRLINDYFEDLNVQGWAPGFFATGLPRNPDPMPLVPLAGTDGTTPTFGPLEVVADPAAPCETAGVHVPGQTVRVSGKGFAPTESVAVRVKLANQVASVALGSVTADGSGDIDDVVTLPAGVVTPTFATIEALGAGLSGAGHLAVELIRFEDSFTTDTDTDGISDLCDVCPGFSSADQTDSDGDGVGDLCDACPLEFENDADGDGLCAAVDPCPFDVENDADNDGRCASEDNCPLGFNPAQVDSDGDGRGDLCADALCHLVDVTVRPAPGGEVVFETSNCGLDTYYEDTSLSLAAVPDLAGYHFTGWTGDVSVTANPLALSVDGPLQIKANFCTDPTDGDGDLVGDACDNCPVEINSDQIDGDGDLAGDACDCAPADSGVFSAPGEIANVAVMADKETIAWTSMAATAGSATVYDVVRGDVGSLPVGTGAETCLATATSTASVQDASTPTAGAGFYYVVRAVNSCGTGTFGNADGGTERNTTTCP